MNDYNINVKLNEVMTAINDVKSEIDIIKKTVKSEEDLWDGSDIIRNWKVSERTLAEWRRKKMIGYVQIHKKIFYPRESREQFLKVNYFNNNKGGLNE